MRIINSKCTTAYSVEFSSENDFFLAPVTSSAMIAEINMFPSIILDSIIHNVVAKGCIVIKPNSPKIFRLIRIFYNYKSNAFALEFRIIIYFIFPIRTIVLVKFNIVISKKRNKF